MRGVRPDPPSRPLLDLDAAEHRPGGHANEPRPGQRRPGRALVALAAEQRKARQRDREAGRSRDLDAAEENEDDDPRFGFLDLRLAEVQLDATEDRENRQPSPKAPTAALLRAAEHADKPTAKRAGLGVDLAGELTLVAGADVGLFCAHALRVAPRAATRIGESPPSAR